MHSTAVVAHADDCLVVTAEVCNLRITDLRCCQLMSDDSNFGHFQMLDLDVSKFLKLDGAAIRALHLTPLRGEGASLLDAAVRLTVVAVPANKNTSLYGVLNKCRTAMGQRRLMQWIKQPLLDLQELGFFMPALNFTKTLP